MRITINLVPFELPEGATVAEALTRYGATPPFAVALNREFVHRQAHATTVLEPLDVLEIVQPVAGG